MIPFPVVHVCRNSLLVAEQLYKRPRVSVCVSVPNFYYDRIFFGSGSGVPLSQDVVTSNGGAWLSNATLRFFSLAEQCHIHEFLTTSKLKTTSKKNMTTKTKTTSKIKMTTKMKTTSKMKTT